MTRTGLRRKPRSNRSVNRRLALESLCGRQLLAADFVLLARDVPSEAVRGQPLSFGLGIWNPDSTLVQSHLQFDFPDSMRDITIRVSKSGVAVGPSNITTPQPPFGFGGDVEGQCLPGPPFGFPVITDTDLGYVPRDFQDSFCSRDAFQWYTINAIIAQSAGATITVGAELSIDGAEANEPAQVSLSIPVEGTHTADLSATIDQNLNRFVPGGDYRHDVTFENRGDRRTEAELQVTIAPEVSDLAWTRTVTSTPFDPIERIENMRSDEGFTISGMPGIGSSLIPTLPWQSKDAAGDFNGDGIDDLLFANIRGTFDWLYTSSTIIHGSSDGLGGKMDFAALQPEQTVTLPDVPNLRTVSSVGDLNGDGIDDIGLLGTGGLTVLFGSASSDYSSTVDGTNGFFLSLDAPSSTGAVRKAGDFNGDGLDDLVVVRPDTNRESAGGEVVVVFGRSTAYPATIDGSDLSGPANSHPFGMRIAGLESYEFWAGEVAGTDLTVADINGDSLSDLVLNASQWGDGNGRNYVVFGDATPPAVLHLEDLDGSNGFAVSGSYEAPLGGGSFSVSDETGDGIDDLILHRGYRDSSKLIAYNSLLFLPGSADPFPAEVHAQGLVDQGREISFSRFAGMDGYPIQPLGDINADGFVDYWVGNQYLGNEPDQVPHFVIMLGSEEGIHAIESAWAEEANWLRIPIGASLQPKMLSRVGDLNGDGIDDIASGLVFDNHFSTPSSLRVMYGRKSVVVESGVGPVLENIPLKPGDSITYSISGTIPPDATETIRTQARIEPEASIVDSSPGNNSDSVHDIIAPRPTVESITVNGGDSTRSQLTSLSIQFDSVVDHALLESAFEVNNKSTGIAVDQLQIASSLSNNRTHVELTFGTTADGSLLSLPDGEYDLLIKANKVVRQGAALREDLNFGSDPADDFFRLFGDLDGDGDVDGLDYFAWGSSFLRRSGQPGYLSAFDHDRDGDVDGVDYQHFGRNLMRKR